MNIGVHHDSEKPLNALVDGPITHPSTKEEFACVTIREGDGQRIEIYSHDSAAFIRLADAFIQAAERLGPPKTEAIKHQCSIECVGGGCK